MRVYAVGRPGEGAPGGYFSVRIKDGLARVSETGVDGRGKTAVTAVGVEAVAKAVVLALNASGAPAWVAVASRWAAPRRVCLLITNRSAVFRDRGVAAWRIMITKREAIQPRRLAHDNEKREDRMSEITIECQDLRHNA